MSLRRRERFAQKGTRHRPSSIFGPFSWNPGVLQVLSRVKLFAFECRTTAAKGSAKSLIFLVCALVHGSVNAQSFGSFLSDYAPLLGGHPWPRLSASAYTNVSGSWVHPSEPRNHPTVRLELPEDADFTTVVVRCPDGRTFSSYCDAAPSPFAEEVYSGDFNGDGIPDFLMVKPGSGCGLAAEYCTGVFAFSENKRYRFTRINTMGLGLHDLVLDPASKSFRLIHTSFRSAMSSDGRYHSYWVHRFYEWNGVNFQLDPNISPVWIQYLTRANHEPTKLLTPSAKAKAWIEDSVSERRIEW